ncbi:hypothetical protein EJB05_39100, partial [Eragrostis curvula]
MYSYAMLYIPVSTFSLVAATQQAFNSVTSRLINAQRFTALIFNSVVVLTFFAALLSVGSSTDGSTTSKIPPGKYALGFVLTLSASAGYALILDEDAAVCTNVVASTVSVVALFASGEWRAVHGEMAGFENGKVRYVATLVGIALGWQAETLGAVRLITRVSSLFANVTSTLALPLVPIFAVVFFGDKMTGIKVVAMLMAVWGFLSYVYQHYLDDRRAAARKGRAAADCSVYAARVGRLAVVPAQDSDMSE